MQQWICSKLTCCCLVVEVIEFAIRWCERLLCPTDLWICRNILEIESQKENNNQKHWTVKYVLPFQWLQVARSCACRSTGATSSIFVFFCFFVPKGFNWEAGPHWTWTLWRPPVGPGPRHWHWYCPTQSYLHFESCHLMTSSSLQVEPSWRWEIPGQVQVTRFRVHCRTQTDQLSSCGLFLSRAAVRRHISHAQACRSAGLGHREVPIQIRAVDVMAGGGGGAGPAPSIRHQEPGTRTWTEVT